MARAISATRITRSRCSMRSSSRAIPARDLRSVIENAAAGGRPAPAARASARGFGGHGILGQLANHRFDLQEFLQPELAELAAIARLLVAPERHIEGEPACVDEHRAGADAGDDRL